MNEHKIDPSKLTSSYLHDYLEAERVFLEKKEFLRTKSINWVKPDEAVEAGRLGFGFNHLVPASTEDEEKRLERIQRLIAEEDSELKRDAANFRSDFEDFLSQNKNAKKTNMLNWLSDVEGKEPTIDELIERETSDSELIYLYSRKYKNYKIQFLWELWCTAT